MILPTPRSATKNDHRCVRRSIGLAGLGGPLTDCNDQHRRRPRRGRRLCWSTSPRETAPSSTESVDIHIHYDGQAVRDGRMQPSSWHGVTTMVMGNCGFRFAPVATSTWPAVFQGPRG
ncbi:hypothetical protein BL253_36485 [Pseudofrankia asymbiotica]|uniref:Uncharacterized protein n=1 Tax=Pseudofrankia asymbiotica TaxID=1834516 RepID=A0A1V2I1K8_9ACTN|nr:hypothetical protein BL253_36485 [Pseudofrankia asymbiotica]